MKAVKFDRYGDIDVLEVRDVSRPSPGPGEVQVEVKATGINPGEAMIRKGALHDRWPATFPSGQGTDLAGVVAEVGTGAQTFTVGDEVLGFTNKRASQAEFVVVPTNQLTAKPPAVSWEVAGALFVAGTTAYAAVRAVDATRADGRPHAIISHAVRLGPHSKGDDTRPPEVLQAAWALDPLVTLRKRVGEPADAIDGEVAALLRETLAAALAGRTGA